MGYFILGFLIAWLWSSSVTRNKIAAECERLGGFFIGSKTYRCHAIIDLDDDDLDDSIPQAILDAEKK